MNARSRNRFLVAVLWVVGALLLGQGLYMDAKAKVAQTLIAVSWGDSLGQRAADRPPPKPWWWADTRVIAKLSVQRLNKRLYVMQDDSTESLAFGPGHLPGSAEPASNGHVMIAGHRDSHFDFLKNMQLDDVINTQNYRGDALRYRVKKMHIIDTREQQLQLLDDERLTLITCYPFNNFIPGGPLRFLVEAELITDELI